MLDFVKEHWGLLVLGFLLLVMIIVLIVVSYKAKKREEKEQKEPVRTSNKFKSEISSSRKVKAIIKEDIRKEKPAKKQKAKKDSKENDNQKDIEKIIAESAEKEEPKKPEKQVKQANEKKVEKSQNKEPKQQLATEKTKENGESMKKAEAKVEKDESVTYRVVYDKEQRNWIVRIDGGERASKRCATKEEAMKVAKDLAKKKDADLSVHKKNGKFQKQ